MTQEELQGSYDELARLAEDLRRQASDNPSTGLERLIATLGLALGNIAKMVAECKTELNELQMRERNRDRSPNSLRDERALRYFALLRDHERSTLVQAVEATPPNISVKAFAEHVGNAAKQQTWQVENLLQFISAWYAYLAERRTEDDVNFIASIIVDSSEIEPSTRQLLDAAGVTDPASAFMHQLKRLLRCHATLGVSTKAEVLLSRNERQFEHASVSTELRPIFSADVESAPSYGLVLHNLVLALNDGGVSRAIGVALTSKDILTLAEVLNRAWKKESTLRKQSAYKLLPLGT